MRTALHLVVGALAIPFMVIGVVANFVHTAIAVGYELGDKWMRQL